MVRVKPLLPVRSDFSHQLAGQHETLSLTRLPRLLIVEDDVDVREALALTIADCGFEVLQAQDGMAGLAKAERDAPDLVLLDLMLPQRSGIFVLSQLKTRRVRRIPVIMMSGSRDTRHRELAEAHGADGFLLKPFDEQQFLDLAESLSSSWEVPDSTGSSLAVNRYLADRRF